MPLPRFLNLLRWLLLEFEPDEKRRAELFEALNAPTMEEQAARIAAVPAYDDPWHVPGLKMPAWAETESRM